MGASSTRAHLLEVQGTTVPSLGFGTSTLFGDAARIAVIDALQIGYRHVDTARVYANEQWVGLGIRESGVPRSEIFLTSKIFGAPKILTGSHPDAVKWAVMDSLELLDSTYLDLLLLHWPRPEIPLERTLEAMMEVKENGWIRYVGVSNFPVGLMRQVLAVAPVFCNQIEYHPFLSQDRMLELAHQRDFLVTAHSPFAGGLAIANPTLKRIGSVHGKTAAQVALRWLLDQPHVAAVPMAVSHDLRLENWEVFDFALTLEEKAEINGLPKNIRVANAAWAPNWDA